MRHCFVVLFVLVLAACNSGSKYHSDPLEVFEEYFNLIPPTGEVAIKFVESFPRYHTLLESNLTERTVRGLHVDFVLMIHEQVDQDVSGLVAISQREVAWALQELRPEITAVEDSFSDHLSRERMIEDARVLERDITGEEPTITADEVSLLDGAVQFLEAEPEAWVVGGEDRHLIAFSVLTGLAGLYTGEERFTLLFDLSNIFRSEIVLVKLIDSLRKGGKKRGAIVFGGGHESDFRHIAAEIGLSANFYCAAKDIPLSQLTLEGLRC